MKINGLQAEIENEGEYVILKLKMHPADFVKFVTDCGKMKKSRIPKVLINSDLEVRKKFFLAEIAEYKMANDSKYPTSIYNSFYKYWTESNGKKMKFEDQKFFEIGKRLATFWSRLSTEEKSKLWQAEKDKPKATLL
jgi:hypothetical protein